jgi:hypothetical protein
MMTPSRQQPVLSRSKGRVFASLALIGLSGCAANYPGPIGISGNLPNKGPILPATNLRLTESLSIPLEKMVFWGAYGAAAYLILDPLNPNWEIEEASFPGDHVHLSMKMKRFYTGGAGEARVVFQQRAKELMRRGGYSGFSILEYNEGLESSVLGSQRVGQGVILLTRRAG